MTSASKSRDTKSFIVPSPKPSDSSETLQPQCFPRLPINMTGRSLSPLSRYLLAHNLREGAHALLSSRISLRPVNHFLPDFQEPLLSWREQNLLEPEMSLPQAGHFSQRKLLHNSTNVLIASTTSPNSSQSISPSLPTQQQVLLQGLGPMYMQVLGLSNGESYGFCQVQQP